MTVIQYLESVGLVVLGVGLLWLSKVYAMPELHDPGVGLLVGGGFYLGGNLRATGKQ